MYMRDMNDSLPGNGAPKIPRVMGPPITGIESPTPYPIARPMPDSRSSTSE